MQRKLTISIHAKVYGGLHALIGHGRIGTFLEDLARPFVSQDDLAAAYQAMARDGEREQEAADWAESSLSDGVDEAR